MFYYYGTVYGSRLVGTLNKTSCDPKKEKEFTTYSSEKIDQELDMFNMLQTSPTEKTGTVQRTEESIDRLSQLKEIEEAAKSKRAKELQEKRYRH